MFSTIRSKMIVTQTMLIVIVMGVVLILFTSLSDDYYLARKMNLIKKAYQQLQNSDLSRLKKGIDIIPKYEENNIKFIISNETYRDVYVSGKYNSVEAVDFKINHYIIEKIDNYKPTITTKTGKYQISGYGIITQNNHKYYVYIYETKAKMIMSLSYNKLFLAIVSLLVIAVGIVVAMFTSNRISKPIKQIEKSASIAIQSGFDVHIDGKNNFKELSSLANSMNTMINQIRNQIKTLEKEIEHKRIVEERRRQFVNNVSHEMKTPLAIISSQVEMIELVDDEQKRKEYCNSVIEEATGMAEMINDMMVIYASQNELETMALEKNNITELVEKKCNKYKDLFEKKNIVFHQDYEKDCFGMANERYFSQAIDNYLTNSIKHSDNDGNVYVRVNHVGDFVRIEVQNEGPAIPDEYKEKIWSMFYRGDTGETLNGQQGSGLGLYIVKSIVTLHNGNCGFDNLDKGIIFWIEIPACNQ